MSTIEIIKAIEALSSFMVALGDSDEYSVAQARAITMDKILKLMEKL